MYGVWIPGKGFLRMKGAVYTTRSKDAAQKMSNKISGASWVVYVDNTILAREEYFLDQEEASGDSYAIIQAAAMAEAFSNTK